MYTEDVLGKNALTLELSHFTAHAFQFTNDTTGKFDDCECTVCVLGVYV